MKAYNITLLTGEEEAWLIHKVIMSGDDETLSTLLASMNQIRRSRLLSHYRALYSKKLSRELEETLAGDYLYLCCSVVTEPCIFLIKEINTLLTEFPGPNEELLIAFLCERSEEELAEVKKHYHKKFRKNLELDIDCYLQPNAAKWIKLLINRKEIDTCCDLKQVATDAQRLINLGFGVSYGNDGPVISYLIKNRCPSHLRLVFAEIRKLGKHPWERIETTMPPDNKHRLTLLLQAIDKPEQFNATMLWTIKSESGRFWKAVLAIRLSRSKKFYKKAELYFQESFHTTIKDQLKEETGGNVLLLLKKLIKF
ncbi:annexin A13 [Halyomorpha halys]|uniref:annexin A13 n=1 Tax=Halyomorpha halys TaxID=286706 RepID=UPI0006D50674|nr:uncharacterized protein LOC106691044 [Halyomorpha halys]